MSPAARLRLLSRPGCHLCEEMGRALVELNLAFEAVNIEDDPVLEARYGEMIPVLMQDDLEVARAPQTSRTLKRALERRGVL